MNNPGEGADWYRTGDRKFLLQQQSLTEFPMRLRSRIAPLLLSAALLAAFSPRLAAGVDPVDRLRRFYDELGSWATNTRTETVNLDGLEKIGAAGLGAEWRRLAQTPDGRSAARDFGRHYARWARSASAEFSVDPFAAASRALHRAGLSGLASYADFCAGEAAYEGGRFAEALASYGRAIAGCPPELPLQQAILLGARGAAAHYAGDYKLALSDARQALDIFRQLGYRAGQGVVYNNLGALYESAGRNDQARICYERAVGLLAGTEERHLVDQIRLNLAGVHLAQADWPAARRQLNRASSRAGPLRQARSRALFDYKRGRTAAAVRRLAGALKRAPLGEASRLDALLLLGQIQATQRSGQAAALLRDCYQQALAAGRTELAWQSAFELSRCEQSAGNPSSALAWAKRALDSITAWRDTVDPASRFRFYSESETYLSHLLALQVDGGNPWDAFDDLERFRQARLQSLGASVARSSRSATSAEEPRRRSHLELFRRAASGQFHPLELADLEIEVEGRRSSRSSSEKPQQVPSLSELQQHLGSTNSTLVEFFPVGERVAIWIVNADRVDFMLALDSANQWRSWIGQITTDFVQARHNMLAGWDDTLLLRRWLYERLLGPIEPLLAYNLWIVPGPLFEGFPLEVLVRPARSAGERDSLVLDRHSVCYLPLAGLVAVNPTGLGQWAPWQGWYDPSLAHALGEIQSSARHFPGSSTVSTRNGSEALLDGAQRSGVLHLATHAVINGQNPMLSYIPLLPGGRRLYVFELLDAGLAPQLAVLSACHSGTGLGQGPDLPVTLASAFLAAGAKALVVNLWEAPDRTESFFHSFYGHLQAGADSAEALRRAKRDWRIRFQTHGAQHLRLDHPIFWAGWMAVGRISVTRLGRGNVLDASILALLASLTIYSSRKKARQV